MIKLIREVNIVICVVEAPGSQGKLIISWRHDLYRMKI